MTSQWVEKLHFTLQIRRNVRARFLTNTCSAWGSSELMKSDHGLTSEGAKKAGVEPTPPKCNLKTISLFPWCSLYSLSLLDGSRQWLRKILFWPESRSTLGILLIAVLRILALFFLLLCSSTTFSAPLFILNHWSSNCSHNIKLNQNSDCNVQIRHRTNSNSVQQGFQGYNLQ